MQIDSVDTLLIALRMLYPVSFTDAQMPMITDRYRVGLDGLSGNDLNAAWAVLARTWTKRSAPTAADIFAAHNGGRKPSNDSGAPGQATRAALDARLYARSQRLMDDRRQIIAQYEADHPKTYALARAEGWIGILETRVSRAANILSQRNQKRQDGRPLSPIDALAKADYSIDTINDTDVIDINRQMIEDWRAASQIATPEFAKRFPNRFPQITGNRTMAVSA